MNRINGKMETEIFRQAVEALRNNAPVDAKIETLEAEPMLPPVPMRPDCVLKITVQGREFLYFAEIKTTVTKTNRLLLLMGRERLAHPLMIVAKYVNPQVAEQLRADGM